jgi:hypothetical protein
MNIVEAANKLMEADETKNLVDEEGLLLALDKDGFIVYPESEQYARLHVSDLLSDKWSVVDE